VDLINSNINQMHFYNETDEKHEEDVL